MSQSARGNFYDDVQDDHEYLDSFERDTDDENYEGAPNDNAHNHSSGFVHLSSLDDDDALFNMLKKSVSYLFFRFKNALSFMISVLVPCSIL